ncbi:hypothetical protein ACHRV5_19185 [Flavobacterium sp. FlaQc-52]|uniref:hypothetical protein n=1 Tax=Flavobacterium sp. FlaQc-52 TaxID=3374185 RepID=UPI0037568C0F
MATPTIVCVLKKGSDTCVTFSCSEEEQSHKELKAAVYAAIFQHELVMPVFNESKNIVSGNIVELDNISPSIFAPPPNLA